MSESKVNDLVAQFSVYDVLAFVIYALFGRWSSQRVYFVTRMKDNALCPVVQERKVPQYRHVLKDELIQLTGLGAELLSIPV